MEWTRNNSRRRQGTAITFTPFFITLNDVKEVLYVGRFFTSSVLLRVFVKYLSSDNALQVRLLTNVDTRASF